MPISLSSTGDGRRYSHLGVTSLVRLLKKEHILHRLYTPRYSLQPHFLRYICIACSRLPQDFNVSAESDDPGG